MTSTAQFRIIRLCAIAGVTVSGAFIPVGLLMGGRPVGPMFSLAGGLLCLWLLQKGFVRVAAALVVAGAWTALAVGAITEGGLTSHHLPGLPLCVLGTLCIFGYRAAPWSLVGVLSLFGLLFGLDAMGLVGQANQPMTEAYALMGIGVPTTVAGLLAFLTMRELEQTTNELQINNEMGTEHRRRLMHTDALFAHIGASVEDGIFLCKPDLSDLIVVGGAFERLTGLTASEMAEDPKRLLALIHPADRGAASGWIYGVEYGALKVRVILEGGVERIWMQRMALVDTEAGPRVVALISDITQREAQKTVGRARRQDLARMRTLELVGRLAGGLIHDLNNLLTVISGGAALASQQIEDVDAKEDLDEIQRAVERGSALTMSLQSFARGEPTPLQVINVKKQVVRLMSLLRALLPPSIELHLDLPDDAIAVNGDGGQLERVLVNLVVNARDAFAGSSGQIWIALEADAHQVRLRVEDDGPGMDEETANRCFEPFFTARSGGTGLGLATVYGIVKQWGGDVVLDTLPGRGTRVSLLMNRCQVEGTPNSVSRIGTPSEGVQGRVLLVEDDDATRRVLARSLRRSGLQVQTASSAEQAAELEGLFDIDILICDMVLPGDSGADLVRAMRALGYTPEVVMITGYSRRRIPAEVNASVVLRKPFEPAALLAAVHRISRMKATGSGAAESGTPTDRGS